MLICLCIFIDGSLSVQDGVRVHSVLTLCVLNVLTSCVYTESCQNNTGARDNKLETGSRLCFISIIVVFPGNDSVTMKINKKRIIS